MINKSSLEILAPCGSYDILAAAINAGADACYIGGNKFGARAFAENLGADSIYKAIDYAHLHNTKLYLTVNTLFKQHELKEVYNYLIPYYEAGIDAVIVQDLGGFSMIKECFPELAIHCSTQMNINSVHAARLMKEAGAARVVTAREMPLSEIAAIKKEVDIEVETFVHGAMCYSYSGQCLLSSVSGERSGNRGRCAQPCRKCYDRQYLLSMKDMCSLTILPEIINAGIDSLKIEGRMKNAYYVASCVSAYKEIADDCLNDSFNMDKAVRLKEKLANIYNRGGFCEGYFFTANGPRMISIDRPNNSGVFVGKINSISNGKIQVKLDKDIYKQDVFEIKLKDNNLVEITSAIDGKAGTTVWLNCPKTKLVEIGGQLRRTRCNYIIDDIENNIIKRNRPTTELNIVFYGMPGEKLKMKAEALSNTFLEDICVESELIAEESKNRPVISKNIEDKILQLNNDNFKINNVTCEISDRLFFPIGEVKRLRRELIEKIEEKITLNYRKKRKNVLPYIDSVDNKDNSELCTPRLNIYVSTIEQLKAVLEYDDIYGICLTRSIYNAAKYEGLLDIIRAKEIKLYISLPYIVKVDTKLEAYLSDIEYDGLCIRNIDGLACVLEANQSDLENKDIICANTLYSYNDKSHQFMEGLLNKKIIFESPPELKAEELKMVNINILELTIYTHQRVMLSRQCIQKTKYNCNKNNNINKITDDNGNSFFALSHCEECCNLVYNGVAYCLFDKLKQPELVKLKPKYYKIEFTIENSNIVKSVMDDYYNALAGQDIMIDRKTYGHMYRGVE